VDFRQFYYFSLESYLFHTVSPRFAKEKQLSAFDFFCIVAWKANRAKSKIAKKLLSKSPGEYDSIEAAVHALTSELAQKNAPEDRLRYLWEEWKIRVPMATAILTVLYPEEFTVYDVRVRKQLNFHSLENYVRFESLWRAYQEYKRRVEESTPREFTLRDKDRFLWGKSFHEQLMRDISRNFERQLT
jgi:hypothetical protein